AFDELIEMVARDHNIDASLIKAMVQAESAFNPVAVSPEGARGLMQLLPNTASQYAVSDLEDPRQNLQGGVRHVKYLLHRFQGKEERAIAAYNDGEFALKRYAGIPPYPETRRYVYKVVGLRKLYAGGS
ncbi:MAG: lytic transglycosylase domain-containing protein, partial [Gammaproteobacteria bacterium]|nr:lytic transglycosylase domain-containing protein [Gammaproteobacteria bacterium]